MLLATMLAVAACGGSDTGRSEPAAPTEPQRAQAESSGLRVTTIEGEEVRLGGQGDVTALYFMAGW